MEGVVVSAKKVGGTVTISVATDDKGRFSFPAAKLEPGQYEVKLITQPLVFTKFDGDGKAVDSNWPMDETPAKKKATELSLKFTVGSK